MSACGVKIRNYQCFKSDPQGFDDLKLVNVIIGRNNSGKSALLDLIKYVCEETLHGTQPEENFNNHVVFFSHTTGQEVFEVVEYVASHMTGYANFNNWNGAPLSYRLASNASSINPNNDCLNSLLVKLGGCRSGEPRLSRWREAVSVGAAPLVPRREALPP